MIRLATASELPQHSEDESMIRIISWARAYGDVAFIQYLTDDSGNYLAVMDGVGLFYAAELTDEWCCFLQMNPHIQTLHTSGIIGSHLLNTEQWQGEVGEILHFEGDCTKAMDVVCTNPRLPDVHALLSETFPGISPLNYWYPDASHRLRHECCHIGCILHDDKVVSTAMTVAETDTAAIIGQVATHTAFRRQGLAGKCIKSVISQCEGKQLYILPMHEAAAKLYHDLGFAVCGTWAEIHKL